jgi:hypothetical protein
MIQATDPHDFFVLPDGTTCHAPSNLPVNMTDPETTHCITVLGLIDDSELELGDIPYWDVVAYWPACDGAKWTVTHQCRADVDADDYPANVKVWTPLPMVPRQIPDRTLRAKYLQEQAAAGKAASIPTLTTEVVKAMFNTTAQAWADTPLANVLTAA